MVDHYAALIYTMVIASAADQDMTDAELGMIGDIVRHLPVFRGFDLDKLPRVARDCAELLDHENGLENAFDVIKGSLPVRLRETAYALACDVVAADGHASQEELRLLQLLQDALGLDRLIAVAIERAARARYAWLDGPEG
jgi:tellurite resistance protein